MLQLQKIRKVYKTGALVQTALDDVSLNLRDNEFVAILGPSGSGKTTLLNVIGGLDRYDSGDLVINGVSTKKYSARDWDSYRNHTVGFVFQSYNLIPHQNILSNVELALTIGGVSRRERRKRAKDALKKVGLEAHMHKKPSQLSGGQMQRVAIARALVNDPDILLADEPTGALDSETSLQVMDLLKEVARDRLVVMVTHNPELAQKYATRIVRLKDGRVTDDTDPFVPEAAALPAHKNMGKASMSLLTSLSLSFHNLRTKKVRTLLIAFAGSIGIIGIAMILSMSNGVDRYIQNVEQDTLKSYPLQITDSSFNLANFMPNQAGEDKNGPPAEVRERKTITNLLSTVSVNDLASLRAYLESGKSDVYNYVQSIEYGYSITPQIFSVTDSTVRQVNPDRSFTALGFTAADNMNGMLSALSSTDSFHIMPKNRQIYQEKYQVKAGHWPEAWNECVLVLSSTGRVSDLALYTMGLKDPAELEQMVRSFAEGGQIQVDETEQTYSYQDFIGITFRMLPASRFYNYDENYQVWTDRSGDEAFLRGALADADTLTIVGVVQPLEDGVTQTLQIGVNYPAELEERLMAEAAQSAIVRAQLDDPDLDVFTGRPFGQEAGKGDVDMSRLFNVDRDTLKKAFGLDPEQPLFDPSQMDFSDFDLSDVDLSGSVDPGIFYSAMPSISSDQISKLMRGVRLQMSPEQMEVLVAELMQGYLQASAGDPSTDLTALPGAISSYLASDDAAERIRSGIQKAWTENNAAVVTQEEMLTIVESVLAGYPDYLAENGLEDGDIPMAYLGEYLRSPAAQAALTQAASTLNERVLNFTLSPAQINAVTSDLAAGYADYAQANSLPNPDAIRRSFSDYLSSDEASGYLSDALAGALDTSGMEREARKLFAGYSGQLAGAMTKAGEQMLASAGDAIRGELTKQMGALGDQLQTQLEDAFQIDPETFSEAFSMNLTPEELRDLMTTLMSRQGNTYDGNLRKLGYGAEERPTSITIYPIDFAGKKAVKGILEDYNRQMLAAGEEDKVISYTDIVDTLMSSVTDIVDAISTVLIAFVAISLVVSSVMIGVITYISVLERHKEIGILRAIGASKRNISQVFNAETFIIGALAGLLGVGITYLLLIPANHIIARLAKGVEIRAFLPLTSAGILVLISIVLTMIGGLIPAKKAARSDPVAALRSE